MSSRCLYWRPRRAKIKFSVASHDMTNVFSSSKHEVMEDNDAKLYDNVSDIALVRHHRDCMVAKVDAIGGEVFLLAQAGGFLGDGNAPDEFFMALHSFVSKWRLKGTRRLTATMSRSPLSLPPAKVHDVGITTCVDDILDYQAGYEREGEVAWRMLMNNLWMPHVGTAWLPPLHGVDVPPAGMAWLPPPLLPHPPGSYLL